jgi:hypothetical protein
MRFATAGGAGADRLGTATRVVRGSTGAPVLRSVLDVHAESIADAIATRIQRLAMNGM